MREKLHEDSNKHFFLEETLHLLSYFKDDQRRLHLDVFAKMIRRGFAPTFASMLAPPLANLAAVRASRVLAAHVADRPDTRLAAHQPRRACS